MCWKYEKWASIRIWVTDKGPIAMARWLVQSISKKAGLVGCSATQWLVPTESCPKKDNQWTGCRATKQYNSPCHTTKKVQDWFKHDKGVEIPISPIPVQSSVCEMFSPSIQRCTSQLTGLYILLLGLGLHSIPSEILWSSCYDESELFWWH